CLLVGYSTWLFNAGSIDGIEWMTFTGVGLYMAYIPYNAIFFERMIATFRTNGNVGFIMYVADSVGYLGSVSVLLIKEFGGSPLISWTYVFQQALFAVSTIGAVAAIGSFVYFLQKKQKQKKLENNYQILPL